MPKLTAQGPAASRAALLRIADVDCLADCSGVMFIPGAQALVVADLHLEKGSAFAQRGLMLPPYDTQATLAALTRVIAHYAPKLVIALGDSFHDAQAGERLGMESRGELKALASGRDWIWIGGNHDPVIPDGLGELHSSFTLAPTTTGALTFRHEPSPALLNASSAAGEVAGHLHPAARAVTRSGSARRKCFIADGSRCILPAFGAYTGGLSIHDAAFNGLFSEGAIAYLLGRERVYRVAAAQCL
ncbi:MAG: ligase-associated DNA damage response endonuclease PdeM [Alphaproteobacteria bacterium]|nr:ligase-associated DNA damage response endonuclease PdeM [Alphaproteobacteria bacterium]